MKLASSKILYELIHKPQTAKDLKFLLGDTEKLTTIRQRLYELKDARMIYSSGRGFWHINLRR